MTHTHTHTTHHTHTPHTHIRTHICARTHTRAHTHAHTRTHARKHTHPFAHNSFTYSSFTFYTSHHITPSLLPSPPCPPLSHEHTHTTSTRTDTVIQEKISSQDGGASGQVRRDPPRVCIPCISRVCIPCVCVYIVCVCTLWGVYKCTSVRCFWWRNVGDVVVWWCVCMSGVTSTPPIY
jgi:hypothetical protein